MEKVSGLCAWLRPEDRRLGKLEAALIDCPKVSGEGGEQACIRVRDCRKSNGAPELRF